MKLTGKEDTNWWEIFKEKLVNSWETEELQDKSIIRFQRYLYEIKPETIYIYQGTKSTIKAIFRPEKSWIDDKRLFDLLSEILPEFYDYFHHNQNLISGKFKVEIED